MGRRSKNPIDMSLLFPESTTFYVRRQGDGRVNSLREKLTRMYVSLYDYSRHDIKDLSETRGLRCDASDFCLCNHMQRAFFDSAKRTSTVYARCKTISQNHIDVYNVVHRSIFSRPLTFSCYHPLSPSSSFSSLVRLALH